MEKITKAQKLHTQGKSLRQIAEIMGVGKSTVSRWLKKEPVNKSLINPQFVTMRGAGGGFADIFEVEKEPDFAQLLALNDNTVYKCSNWLSDEVAKIPLGLYTEGIKKTNNPFARLAPISQMSPRLKALGAASRIVNHPALELLERPNPSMTTHGFLKMVDFQMSLCGNSFVHKRREHCELERKGEGRHKEYNEMTGEGYPVRLDVLKIQNIRLGSDTATGEICGIWYSPTGTEVFYPLKDLIWFKLEDNPADPTGLGRGPARAIYERVLLEKYELAYQQALFRNQARPDSIALMPNSTWEQREAFEQQFYQRFSKGAMGGIFAIDTEAEVSELKTLGWQPKDVLGTELYKWTNLQIVSAFKLNAALFDQENSNRAVAESAKQQAYEYAVLPRCHLIEEKLTHCLLQPDFHSSMIAVFDAPPMDDDEFKLEKNKEYLDRKVYTINEVRERDGLAPVPWGDKPYQESQPKVAPNPNEEREPQS